MLKKGLSILREILYVTLLVVLCVIIVLIDEIWTTIEGGHRYDNPGQ